MLSLFTGSSDERERRDQGRRGRPYNRRYANGNRGQRRRNRNSEAEMNGEHSDEGKLHFVRPHLTHLVTDIHVLMPLKNALGI